MSNFFFVSVGLRPHHKKLILLIYIISPSKICLVKRVDSIQSRRKVSSLSDRSDTSEQGMVSGEESPGILSDDQQPESPTDSNETDDTAKNMPWLKAVIDLITSYNYYCSHKGYCHPYCYKRHMRSCTRLMKATRKVNQKVNLR